MIKSEILNVATSGTHCHRWNLGG